ncbi:MAG: hypothetical protein FWG55_06655 [Candidatus Bathyarchaeota archaeon]|nr:hypothetical protein [Candidatus Termiticorpusculum sp.]
MSCKDYYDVWRLLKTRRCDQAKVKELFLRKCEAKNVGFVGVDQLFPKDLVDLLEPHLEVGLTRLSSEPLPSIEVNDCGNKNRSNNPAILN